MLASIRKLDPWTISWNTICDYYHVEDFHKLLWACSGKDTVHLMISLNWASETFGAHILDYDNKEYRREIFNVAQKFIAMGKLIDRSGYFRYNNVITHPYNIGDIDAANLVKDKWKDYFFKGANNAKVIEVMFSHTHEIHTFMNIYFTYNKKINYYVGTTSPADVF